jgi:hypothetical protein
MYKIVSIVAIGLAILLSSCSKDPGPAGPKGKLARRDLRVRKAHRECKAYPGRKGRRAHRAHKGHKVLLAIPVQRAIRER